MSVFEKNGNWGFRISARKPGGGKWSKQVTGFDSEAEALGEEYKALAEYYGDRIKATAKNLSPPDIMSLLTPSPPDSAESEYGIRTVAQLHSAYVEKLKIEGCSPVTISDRQAFFEQYCTSIAEKRVSEIQPVQIQEMLNDLRNRRTGEKLKSESVRGIYRQLSSLFNYAKRLEIISRSPCRNILLPRREKHQPTIYTSTQIRTLLDGLRGQALYWPVALSARLGLRHGEALGIRWRDIDFETGEVAIRGNLVTLKGIGSALSRPKTEASASSVFCPASFLEELREYKDRRVAHDYYAFGEPLGAKPVPRAEFDKREFLCLSPRNTVYTQRNSVQQLHGAQDRLGLPRGTWHDLRHTWATLLIESGEDISTVSKGLRHTALSTTANIYLAPTEAVKRKSTDAFDALIGRNGKEDKES